LDLFNPDRTAPRDKAAEPIGTSFRHDK